MSAHRQPNRDDALLLPDGRRLGFAEYGDPAGRPVLFLHGTPGSRLFDPAMIGLDEAPEPGRLLTIDRPGYGRSTFAAGWRIPDMAGDVAALADALGIARLALLSNSGGGPYAAACAARLSPRVAALCLVSSPAPQPPDRSIGAAAGADHAPAALDAETLAARTLGFADFQQWRAQQWGPGTPDPEQMLRGWVDYLPDVDRPLLYDPRIFGSLRTTLAEGFRPGPEGWVFDEWLARRPWGFALEAVQTPVLLWHGIEDLTVPVEQGRYLAAAIPGCRTHLLPDVGHIMPPAQWPGIWQALLTAAG